MGFATGLVRKRVEDAEGRRAKLYPEPHNGRWFLLHERKTRADEVGDGLFFSWFRFKADPQSDLRFLSHGINPLSSRRKARRKCEVGERFQTLLRGPAESRGNIID